MKPSIQTLGAILYSPSQYVIPVFQRNYRWEQPQWGKLWDNLIGFQQPDKTGNHFMGFLVFVPGLPQPGQHTRFHLIDGQQRLTTTSLLLIAIRNLARRLEQGELAQEIHDDYLVHPRKKGEYHYRVLPKDRDQANYLALVDKNLAPAGRMADAVDWFEDKLTSVVEGHPEALRAIFNTVLQRLEFMCATLEAENAYNIFKSLNSTGVPLGSADLIRNFVFMHVPPDDQDDFDANKWSPLEAMFTGASGRLDDESLSRFFRDMLMMDGRYVSPADTFATFEARHEATGFLPDEMVDSILANATNYQIITGRTLDHEPSVTTALHGLNLLDSSTTYPVLLALFDLRSKEQIDAAQLIQCIEMLRGFILRRFICGDSSRGYGRMFVRALIKTSNNPVDALKNYLLERGWPDDRRFIEAFVRFPLYKRGYAREVLETLERARGHKEQANLGAAQIEHVMPQTLSDKWVEALGGEAARIHADWLHCPGNLTLSAYNQEVGNQPFEQKRQRFADSNIGLTREVAGAPTWSEDAIRTRGEVMAQEAAALWAGPKEPWQPQRGTTAQSRNGVDRHELQLRFWNGLLDHLADKHPEVPEFEPRPKRAIRLPVAVLHIGLEVRFLVQPAKVAVDLYFWRAPVFPIWEALIRDSAVVDAMIGERWEFDRTAERTRWMTVIRSCNPYDEGGWPTVIRWLGEKLNQVYASVIPYLQDEFLALHPDAQISPDDGDADGRFSATQRQHQRFWAALADAMSTQDTPLRAQKPLPQHWTNYAIGRSGFSIVPTVNSRDARIGVALEIATSNSNQQFQTLLTQRAAIESELGFALDWQELPNKVTSRIGCWRDECPAGDEPRWPEYVEWMVERISKLDHVFRPRVRELP